MKNYYALFDTKAGVFGTPILEHNDGTAIRALQAVVRDPEGPIGRHPEDFVLFQVGEWDELDGKMTGCTPRSITTAASLLVVKGGE